MTATIISISNDSNMQQKLKLFLAELGYHNCNLAYNEKSLLRLIDETNPALIILHLKPHSLTKDLQFFIDITSKIVHPFMLISEKHDPAIFAVVQNTSTFGYLHEPFTRDDLHFYIEMTMFRARQVTSLRALNQQLALEVNERVKAEHALESAQRKLEIQNADLQNCIMPSNRARKLLSLLIVTAILSMPIRVSQQSPVIL